jgi:hypothetical protein
MASWSQTRVISGIIIDENLETIPYARIESLDSAFLGFTNREGRFEIEVPNRITNLTVQFVGYETAYIQLSIECQVLEIVLMEFATYDFTSARKVERLTKKRFKRLPKVHYKAFEIGLFENKRPCFERDFKSRNG